MRTQTREDRVRTAKLSAYYERLNKATAKVERDELNALLTDEQKALTPCVDFGFVDDEDADPMEGISLEALAQMVGQYDCQRMMERGIATW